MSAQAILDELLARGAKVYRVGTALAVEPRRVLDDALRAAIRAERERLLELVPEEADSPEPHAPAPPGPNVLARLVETEAQGHLWLALDEASADELRRYERAWEALGDEPLPVMTAAEVGRLDGKGPETVGTVLRVFLTFPGSRVVA